VVVENANQDPNILCHYERSLRHWPRHSHHVTLFLYLPLLPEEQVSLASSLTVHDKMRLLKALTELPLSLVLTTLSVVSSVSGAQLQQLTPANFKDSTARGLWFVEHFSPYCVHCRQFAPTWEKLVGDCEKEIPSVHLAQVDCSVNGGV
jgi:hypothetical protein